MKSIEIICVGNELLSGITLNTNAHWLAGQISKAGGVVHRVTIVRDELGEISTAVCESISRKPAMLLVTGGLGATYDDMTLEGLARALGKKVYLDKRAVAMLKKSYDHRGLDYELTESRLKMATIPQGAVPLQNLVGSAPGIRLKTKVTQIFCLQGVPAEMQATFQIHVLPLIKKSAARFLLLDAKFQVAGITEAMLAPELSKIVRLGSKKFLYIKTHPRGYVGKTPRLMVHIVSKGTNPVLVKARLSRAIKSLENETKMLGGVWTKEVGD